MPSGDNKCDRCGQWAGGGHACASGSGEAGGTDVLVAAGEGAPSDTGGTKVVYDDGAITYEDARGLLHRTDGGPALRRPDGHHEWRVNGQLHRTDGPALIREDMSREWWQDGHVHRTDGPAVIYPDGAKEWHDRGQLHRYEGPAIVDPDGDVEWWHRGHLLHQGHAAGDVEPRPDDPADDPHHRVGGVRAAAEFDPVSLTPGSMPLDADWSRGRASTAPHGDGPSTWGLYRTPGGAIARAYRTGQKVQFYDPLGMKFGAEQKNVAPAMAWVQQSGLAEIRPDDPDLAAIFDRASKEGRLDEG